MQPQSGIAVAAVSSQLLGDGVWPVLPTFAAMVSFLVALTFHFWDCAITVCIREIQAKSENAVVQKDNRGKRSIHFFENLSILQSSAFTHNCLKSVIRLLQ